MGALDGVGCDSEILIKELGRKRIVGVDTADLGRRDDRDIGPLGREERLDSSGRRKVELPPRAQHELDTRLALKTPHQRAAYHAVVTCDKKFHGSLGFTTSQTK